MSARRSASERLLAVVTQQRLLLAWAAHNVEEYAEGDVGDSAINNLRSQLLGLLSLTLEAEAIAFIIEEREPARQAVTQ